MRVPVLASFAASMSLVAGGALGADGQTTETARHVHYFPSTAVASVREGYVRVVNHSKWAGEVWIQPITESGQRLRILTLAIAARETKHFNSHDLENGNVTKGLAGGAGTTDGDWRLELTSNLDIDVAAYVRTVDGFMTSLHDLVRSFGNHHVVTIFNPASNANQRSLLRLVNLGDVAAEVTIAGTDDAGASPSGSVATVMVEAGATRTVASPELEDVIGDGRGKWRLDVASTAPLAVMSLLESPTGHISNLSTAGQGRQPALVEDHFEETRALTPDKGRTAVASAVVDAQGFGPEDHGGRITAIYTENLRDPGRVRLAQIDGWCRYRIAGVTVGGRNTCGFVRHALHYSGGGAATVIFWTASDQSPQYLPGRSGWFVADGRPFTEGAREFARWARRQNVLYVSSLENPSARRLDDGSFEAVYCDDYDNDPDGWTPLCGELDDYIAHSGVGLDRVVFVGAIYDLGGDETARAGIRGDGVFAQHAIYVGSPNGSTSQATPVLAAYATNLAVANPAWDAARVRRALFEMAREERLRHATGASSGGAGVYEERTVRVIRPEFAP